MKPNDLKNIYSKSTDDFHNAMLCSLVKLNDKAQRRYKRHRVLKIVVICIIIVCLCTTSVLAATNLYGVFTDKVSNYGVNVNVVPKENKKLPEYVKLTLEYLPEGVIETLHTDGEKYSLNGEAAEKCCSFSIIVLDDEFNITNDYIIDSTEKIINGNRVIINTRKFDDSSEFTQTIFYEYFDNLGVVLSGWCDNTISDEEVELIIAGAEVSEGTEDDHFERVDLASELSQSTIPTIDMYDLTNKYVTNYTLGEYGKSFEYSEFPVDEKEFKINVKSFELHDNVSDLNQDNFDFMEYDGDKPYSTYFDENGDIISDYIRIETEYGNGINSIDKSTEVNAKRHFVLAKLDVTALEPMEEFGFDILNLLTYNMKADESGNLATKSDDYYAGTMVYNNGVDEGMNMIYISGGETREIVIGFFVDEDQLEDLYFSVVSRTWKADDDSEDTVCFPLERSQYE